MKNASPSLWLALVLAACGGSTAPTTESTSETETSGSTETPSAAGTSCADATNCDACLAIDGCNWTADQCSTQCLMDTWCMGPGNPAAPICTTPPVMTGGPGEG